MIWLEWNKLPRSMQTPEVRKYYDILNKKRTALKLKRAFDVLISAMMLMVLAPLFLILSAAIKLDSPGPVFFRQERVTQYGRRFKIHKFRTMVNDAEKCGSSVTVKNDSRITRIGSLIRKYRIDEIPQLIDILNGDMSFVGTRPEVVKYVKCYSHEMLATLLLPAGVTSEASISYKDEDRLLSEADDVDAVYVEDILPQKMRYNLMSVEKYSFFSDIHTMIKTIKAVLE